MDSASERAPNAGLLLRMWLLAGLTLVPLALVSLGIMRTGAALSGRLVLFGAIPAVFLLLALKRIEPAGVLNLAVLALACLVAISWIDGIGIILGITFALVGYGIVNLALPDRVRSRAFGMVAIVATSIVFVDLFSPLNRFPFVGQGYLLTLVASGVAAIFLVVIILRPFRDYDLRTKFLTSVAILAVTAVIINILYTSATSRGIAFDSAGETLKSRAVEKASLLGLSLGASVDRLSIAGRDTAITSRLIFRNSDYAGMTPAMVTEILAVNQAAWAEGEAGLEPAIRRALNSSAADRLRAIRQSTPEFLHIVVTDQQGAVVAMTDYVPIYDYSGADWFDPAARGTIFIGMPYVEPTSGEHVFDIAVPVFLDEDRFGGVLRGSYRLASLRSLEAISGAYYGEISGFLDVIFGDQLVDFNNEELAISPVPLNSSRLNQLAGETFGVHTYKGTRSLVALAPVTNPTLPELSAANLRILKYIPEEEVLSSIASQQRGLVLLGLATIVVSILAAVGVSGIVTRPIISLTHTAEKMAAGDLGARAPVVAGDEIATLAVTFNLLADQVESAVQNLEKRVAERTQALQTTFRISRSLVSMTDREELVQAIVRELVEAFAYPHVHIYLFNQDKTALDLVAGSNGLPGTATGAAGSGEMVRRAAETNAGTLVAGPEGPHAEIAVPISIGQEVLGVIAVQGDSGLGLDDEDRELLQSIADQTAVALRNAENLRLAQQRGQREAQIYSVRRKILETRDLESAVRTAVRELAQLTRGSADLHLGLPATREGWEDGTGEGKNGA